MRRSVGYLALQLLWLMPLAAAGQIATHSRTASFSTIRASHSEIFAAVERVRAFVHRANSDQDQGYASESLLLSGGGSELKLDRGFSQEDLSGGPRPASRIWYEYSNLSSPISQVDIDLGDYSREIEVEGTSQEQVDALLAMLTNDVDRLESGFGGFGHRFAGGTVLLLVGAVLAGIASTPNPLKGMARWLVFVLGIAFQISIWVLPWVMWFPGTLVLPESTPFLERNGPFISLLGLLLTLGTVSIPIGRSILSARRGSTQDQTPDELNGRGHR